MRSLSSILVVIALILAIVFLTMPGSVRLLGITVTLVCVAMLLRDYGK